MEIRRDDPDRRRNFRARHQCDTNPGPKWKARYWSCKMWSSPKVSDLTAKEHSKDVFTNPGEAMKRAKEMGLDGIHSHKDKNGNTVFMPGKTHKEYMDKKKVKAEEKVSLRINTKTLKLVKFSPSREEAFTRRMVGYLFLQKEASPASGKT